MSKTKVALAALLVLVLVLAGAYYAGSAAKGELLIASDGLPSIPAFAIIALECNKGNATCAAIKSSDCFNLAVDNVSLSPAQAECVISRHGQNDAIRRECKAYVDAVGAWRETVVATNEVFLALDYLFIGQDADGRLYSKVGVDFTGFRKAASNALSALAGCMSELGRLPR